jgi:hypothetical protein
MLHRKLTLIGVLLGVSILSACADANYRAQGVAPDETTEQFVARVINSSGGGVGL